MAGIKVNIKTGLITPLKDVAIQRTEARYCLWCDRPFDVTSATGTKYCSMSCFNHTKLTVTAGRKYTKKKPVDIVPSLVTKDRVKMPRFVKNEHQWAIRTYGKYIGTPRTPRKGSEEWALYKYGEWLYTNYKYFKKE